jgi:hypothetical protein
VRKTSLGIFSAAEIASTQEAILEKQIFFALPREFYKLAGWF